VQKESLLSVHQSLQDQRNGVDDRARCERGVDGNPGLQPNGSVRDSHIAVYSDGTKYFFEVHRISNAEEQSLPKVTF
jgi:hypothetical protein